MVYRAEKQNNLEDFLIETVYCDFRDDIIQKIATDFKNKNFASQNDLAVALFHYVRDAILYRLGLWQRKASETFREGSGTCTNKANLLVALLRACSIPAGYGVMKVKGKEYFGPIILPIFKDYVGEKSVHVYAFVFLNNKWIKCDPSDDIDLSMNTSDLNPQSKLVIWNGKEDALLNLDREHILEDLGPLSNIDDVISKKPKNSKSIFLKLANLYVSFLRQNKQRAQNKSDLEIIFKGWLLKNNHFFCYLLLFFGNKFKKCRLK